MLRNMRLIALASVSLSIFAMPAYAQTYRDSGGAVVQGVVPVGGNQSGPLFTPSNPGSVAGTFSASFSGFQPTPSYSYQSVTTTSATYALPTGTVAVFYNTGSTAITAKLGSSSVTVVAGQGDVIQPDSWMAFTVGSATYYAVVGNGGTSSVVASGGAGLPTGAGGGGGGSASIPTGSAGTPNASVLTVQGVSGGTSVPVTGNFWQTTQPVSLASLPALAAGANTVGAISNTSFGISGTLPAFASTPTVTVGNSSIAVTGAFWQTTQPVSLASLPALAAGSNTIGAISNTSFAATQSGPWNVGLSAGSNTIGKADILGNAGATLDSAAGTANTEALTIQGNASGVPVPVVGTFSATITDGADVTQGSIGDSPWSGTGNGTLDAIMKAIYNAVISPPTPGSTTGGLTFVTKTGINGTPQQIGTTGAHQVYVEHCDNGTSALNTANTYLQYYDTATTPTFGTSVTFADPIAGSLTDGFALSLVGGQIANGIWITAATAPSGNTAPTNSLTCLFGYK